MCTALPVYTHIAETQRSGPGLPSEAGAACALTVFSQRPLGGDPATRVNGLWQLLRTPSQVTQMDGRTAGAEPSWLLSWQQTLSSERPGVELTPESTCLPSWEITSGKPQEQQQSEVLGLSHYP